MSDQEIKEAKAFYIWLIRYRVLAVFVTLFCCILCLDAWLFYKKHYKEFGEITASGGIGLFLLAFLGGIKWSLENVAKRHEGHGE